MDEGAAQMQHWEEMMELRRREFLRLSVWYCRYFNPILITH